MVKPIIFSILFITTVFLGLGSAQAGISGQFIGNGKDAKLSHVAAQKGEPYQGNPTILIFLTEKAPGDQALSKGAAHHGAFGSALVIGVDPSGKLISAQVYHQAHKKKGFSTSGQMELSEYQLVDGKVSGKLKTPKEYEFFGDTWTVDLSFQTPVK